jgi:4-amino-4-deoxy-L-arabinose transferase-like glycosyltransferase
MRSAHVEAGTLAPEWPLERPAPWTETIAWDVVLVLGVTAVALVVRALAVRGLWLDEAISVREASLPFDEMIQALRTSDRHPPLYFALLWLDVRALGTSEAAVRAPSIAAGALLVPALYLAARELWDRRTGRVAAAFGAFAPLVVWYSQEARMYALFMLFSVLCVWAQALALRRGRAFDWAFFVASAGLLAWTHYFGLIQIVVQLLAFEVIAWRRARHGLATRRLLVRSIVSVLLLAAILSPLAEFAREQLTAQSGAFGLADPLPARVSLAPSQSDELSIYRVVTNGGWAVWGYHAGSTMAKLGALWPLAMLLSLVVLGRRCSQATGLVLAAALGPPAVLALASSVRPELFEVRYFAGTAPLLLVLLARATTAWSRTALGTSVLAGAILATLAVGLADQQLSGSNPRRYDFQTQLETVERHAGRNDVVVYAPRYLSDVVSYYAPDVPRRALRAGLPPLPRHDRVFLVASFLDHPSVARHAGKAVWQLEHSGRLVGHSVRNRVSLWVFR